ncbi:MAG: hypothetical protein IIW49_08170 [Treponema sp.]|nr:hypothetical protein [Treponema sp.]
MIYTIIYYAFFSSAVLFYGIGLNRSTLIPSFSEVLGTLFKMLASILATTVLSWLFIQNILIPLGLAELYPLVSLLIFLGITIFFETLIRITAKTVTAEFHISYLIVLLALNESTTIYDVMIISASCLLSFMFIIPIINAIKNRISLVGDTSVNGNYKSLLLVSLAILVVALAVGNISWLNSGVIQ